MKVRHKHFSDSLPEIQLERWITFPGSGRRQHLQVRGMRHLHEKLLKNVEGISGYIYGPLSENNDNLGGGLPDD
jgi:hypothetical protein